MDGSPRVLGSPTHASTSAHAATICPTDTDTIVPSRTASQAQSQSREEDRSPSRPPRHIDKQSASYLWRTGVAGGLAGCAAKTAVGPLDRVKILFQASNPQFAKYTGSWFGVLRAMRDIRRQDGSRGLFRGHSATLLRIFPYAGIKFLAYEQVRAVLIPDKASETSARRFLSGSISGSISVFFTYPLEVIRVRLAFETRNDARRPGLRGICSQIYHERPGLRTPLASTLPSTSSNLAQTTISGASATVEAVENSLIPRYGMANFYRGFTATLWGMLPYAGCSFLTHDSMGDLLRSPSFAPYTVQPEALHASKPRDPEKALPLKAWAQLTAGGVAGFVSQTASYPLEVIRRRMQVGGVVGDGHRLRMGEVASQIWREKGFRGFWVGLSIGYVKVVPMVAISFFVYERCKAFLGV